jgi:glycosyltransferase involved in cell wall biosynthesis
MKRVSILIATKNQEDKIKQAVDSCLNQDWPEKALEVIVLDDGSSDKTLEILKSFKSKERVKVLQPAQGRVKNLNQGIKQAKGEFVCLSAGDIIFEKGFLKEAFKKFSKPQVAFVSPFGETGGNATVFRKTVLWEAGLFDEDFNEKGTSFRDDTDLAFRTWDKGYTCDYLRGHTLFTHEHAPPANWKEKLRYAWNRVKIHRFDALLYKKHPKRTREFLDLKLGFIRNPVKDFRVATGTWADQKSPSLSSPQGTMLLANKTPLHFLAIMLAGLAYVVLVKASRLYGSLKYGTLMF